MPADFVQLISGAAQPAIFASLFIYLFVKSREDAAKILEQTRLDAAEREKYYRETIGKQGAILEKLADQVERIERRLEGVKA